MKRFLEYSLIGVLVGVVAVMVLLAFLARKDVPPSITYGISFNASYARELGLDPLTVLDAFIDDLGARHFRLSGHWTLIEPTRDEFDFALMDAEVARVEAASGTIVMAIGRRLPRWPECHVPQWAQKLSWEEQKAEIREYLTSMVTRYKDSPAITYWQVENEPFLGVFATEHCGPLDRAFLEEEIELVRSLDPTRPILVTDSGNLGTWYEPYQLGDAFGTSVYVYFWNPDLGQFKTILPPWFYRAKDNLMRTLFGDKDTMLIELSLEPWLVEPVTAVPVETQFSRMNPTKFDEIVAYARETRYAKQYLWGGEWWYWLMVNGHGDTFWEKGKTLFTTPE